jgi:hypothetical protein
MTQAIFGLIGVLVGAFVTSGWEFLMERRRERKAFRRSRRLVAEELHTIWVHMLVVEDGKTPTSTTEKTEARFLPTNTWAAHREVMADDALSDDAWNVLPMLFNNAESLRFYLLDQPGGTQLPADKLQLIDGSAAQVAEMYEYLTGTPPGPDRT